MADVRLSTNTLLEAAKKIEDASNRIDGAITYVDNIMAELNMVWSDQHQKEYLMRYDKLKDEFPVFKESIHNYSAFLNAVVKTYLEEFADPTSDSVGKI